MANLAISEELAKRLEQLAAQQQRPIETILEELGRSTNPIRW